MAGDVNALYRGTIRGKSSENIVDFWIIEFDEYFPNYDYRFVTIQHTTIG
jgi:hypothetical protein